MNLRDLRSVPGTVKVVACCARYRSLAAGACIDRDDDSAETDNHTKGTASAYNIIEAIVL